MFTSAIHSSIKDLQSTLKIVYSPSDVGSFPLFISHQPLTHPLSLLTDAQKPHSLDTSSPGTISAVPTNPDSILASFPSTSSSSTNGNGVGDGKELWFTGQQVQTRDVDCVLVWDDALQVES